MNDNDRIRFLESLLCAILTRQGGKLELAAFEICDAGNNFQVQTKADRKQGTVLLCATRKGY
jgi:hypothetical protein